MLGLQPKITTPFGVPIGGTCPNRILFILNQPLKGMMQTGQMHQMKKMVIRRITPLHIFSVKEPRVIVLIWVPDLVLALVGPHLHLLLIEGIPLQPLKTPNALRQLGQSIRGGSWVPLRHKTHLMLGFRIQAGHWPTDPWPTKYANTLNHKNLILVKDQKGSL